MLFSTASEISNENGGCQISEWVFILAKKTIENQFKLNSLFVEENSPSVRVSLRCERIVVDKLMIDTCFSESEFSYSISQVSRYLQERRRHGITELL